MRRRKKTKPRGSALARAEERRYLEQTAGGRYPSSMKLIQEKTERMGLGKAWGIAPVLVPRFHWPYPRVNLNEYGNPK